MREFFISWEELNLIVRNSQSILAFHEDKFQSSVSFDSGRMIMEQNTKRRGFYKKSQHLKGQFMIVNEWIKLYL